MYFSPDFRVIGSLAGDAMLQLKADYAVNFAKWNYSMRFPVPSGVDDKPKSEDTMAEPKVKKETQTPTPQLLLTAVTFGIVFDNTKISNAALDLGVDAYTRLYAEAKVGSEQDFVYCYRADGGAELFTNVEAPTIISSPHWNHWPLWYKPFVIIEKTCSDGSMD